MQHGGRAARPVGRHGAHRGPRCLSPISSSRAAAAPRSSPRCSCSACRGRRGSSRAWAWSAALLHGTKLASCWLAGALAARAREAGAFEGSRERGRFAWSAGAFAVGLLVFSTQLQLFVSFGFDLSGALGYPAEPSLEADLELVRAQSELIVDAFFEAVIMTAWRVYHHASWRELP